MCTYGLPDIEEAMIHLIEHPNFDSPINSYAATVELSKLATKTTRILADLAINDSRSESNGPWCEWIRANNLLPIEGEMKSGIHRKKTMKMKLRASIRTQRRNRISIKASGTSSKRLEVNIIEEKWDIFTTLLREDQSGPNLRQTSSVCSKNASIEEEPLKTALIADFFVPELLKTVKALPPLFSLLNLMRRNENTRPSLTVILWMTPLEAISPSKRIPYKLDCLDFENGSLFIFWNVKTLIELYCGFSGDT
ncbi:unnamed protein product [Hymenolepis diminuta]|uniref:Pentatricopeptide repeat-containing protein n=1 Tax=Hymenolepis diminuta TaxID=6216 RepID=A0A0R3SQT4_HYMDI|nr:unnamed protein product [Hymenolepis diminuta]